MPMAAEPEQLLDIVWTEVSGLCDISGPQRGVVSTTASRKFMTSISL